MAEGSIRRPAAARLVNHPKIGRIPSSQEVLVGQLFVQGQSISAMANGAAESLNRVGRGNLFNAKMTGQTPFPDLSVKKDQFFDLRFGESRSLQGLPGEIPFLKRDYQEGQEQG